MPWKSISVMDSRLEFVRLCRGGGVSVAALCRRFGISRQTGHALLRRHASGGDAALADRSRRPLASPMQTPAAIEAAIVALRTEHPAWGGRKLARRLRDLGLADVPAPSTVTAVLRRHGLIDIEAAARHRAFTRFERPCPNDLWQMDFKGHIATTAGGRCHPLTVIDDHSRYALGLIACPGETLPLVKDHLTGLFRRYGLPRAMLCDNGSPWGSAHAAYTAFEVWLMRLGVRTCHGRPYHPQTQGKDERFHRTLNVELLQPRRFHDLAECQQAFDRWRPIYNEQRPHEALGLAVPASRYTASPAAFPERLAPPEYHASDHVRRVQHDGQARFKGRTIKLSQAFAGLDVAFRPTPTDGCWTVHFMRFQIATIDISQQNSHNQTVRDVSEHLSTISPV